MTKRNKADHFTVDLFADEHTPAGIAAGLDWPARTRFPLNLDDRKVEDTVLPDLKRSISPLLVSGYTSLDRLVDFAAEWAGRSHARLLIGHEPHPSRRESYKLGARSFPREVEHYWLQHGISLHLSAKLLQFITQLEEGHIEVRYLSGSTPLHAKIYVGDTAATLGSSNFSQSGLRLQLEANTRFDATKDTARYRELKQIAENYWSMGQDYRDELIDLLEQLLKVVSWQEALARACAELLEGEWAEAYLRGDYLADAARLWPSQKQGIAQALYILNQQGSVLIADATGSGKTRMGIHLIGAIWDQKLRKGGLRQGKAIMVCPPVVQSAWNMESHLAGVPLDSFSHGKLSHSRSRKHEETVEALRRAQILCVDEGHNFLNLKAQRTQHLLRNIADHVLLFTATPINKSVVDLLHIADMLGADNLEPSTLNAFKRMLGVRNINRSLTDEEIATLREEIQRFTVRRTKRVLNNLIQREPAHYVDKSGRQCRFPRHKPRVYSLQEPPEDREIAARIHQLAEQLAGVTHFVKKIEMPEVLRRQGVSEERYLQGRLSSATKLARYIVTSSLRSSRAALAEHLTGSRCAIADFKIRDFRKSNPTGDVLGKLDDIAGRPPKNGLSIELPEWLTDAETHRAMCEHDRAIYAEIHALLFKLGGQRERCKAEHLLKLLDQHDLVLAFDGRPITLAVIRQGIQELAPKVRVVVATGDADSERAAAMDLFRLGSTEKRLIGLCSDSLSEGVNLQQASALVHLDMPTVVRIAEQRVGRVDRMDSPHAVIEAWWPDDAPEFALSTDERFIERYETVESLLGSNMPLPETMQRHGKPVDPRILIEEYELQEKKGAWDGIQDAFEPVRSLVQGETALVAGNVYDHYRKITARVMSRVSVVKASSPWAFFCLTGGAFGAPRWVLLPDFTGKVFTELSMICEALGERLTPETNDLPFDERGAQLLNRFLDRLVAVERSLLPRRKQRALEEMRIIIGELGSVASGESRQADVEHLKDIIDMLDRNRPHYQPDWDEVAGRWLDVIRPVWFEMLSQRKRARPLLLKDIRKELLKRKSWLLGEVLDQFREFPVLPAPEERVKACIIGID